MPIYLSNDKGDDTMAVSNVNGNTNSDVYKTSKATSSKASEKEEVKEPSNSSTKEIIDTLEITNTGSKTTYKADTETIKKAIEEADMKYGLLKDLVTKLFTKQGNKGVEANWDALIASGKLGDALKNITVDEDTKLQAQKDIAEDGYWGVKQTSQRTLDFAKALTGGDPSKADSMLDAYKKGFKDAENAFGGEGKLPKICYDTYDAVIKGFDEWKNGSSDMASTSTDATIAQATNATVTK
jgi:hypothetical protein